MRKLFQLFFILTISLGFATDGFAQCQDFNEKACDDRLSPFVNYGNYISTELSSGEYAELNMTFYADQQYRIAICGLEKQNNLEFRVYDSARQLLYKNTDDNHSRVWTFQVEDTQQLVIAVNLPENNEEPVSGCVAILKGMTAEQ